MTTDHAAPHEPLWGDERIDSAAMDDGRYPSYYEAARSALRKMRRDYEQHIAAQAAKIERLRAELVAAQSLQDRQGDRWEPLQSGKYEFPNWDSSRVVTLTIERTHGWTELYQHIDGYASGEIALPDEYRLCRRVQGGGQNEG